MSFLHMQHVSSSCANRVYTRMFRIGNWLAYIVLGNSLFTLNLWFTTLVKKVSFVWSQVYTHMFGCRNCRLLEHSRWSYGFKLYQPFYSLYSILLMSFFTSYPVPLLRKILLNDNWNFLSGGFGFHCVLSEGKKKTQFIYTMLIIFVFHFTSWCISYDFIEFYLYFFYYSYSLAHQVSPQLGFSTLSQSSPSFYLNLLWLLQYSSGWTGKWYAFTRLFR